MALGPIPASAHPHEFVDTGITFRLDDEGMLGAVSVVWAWDDLTSMLIAEDLGIDSDGALTPEEKQRLAEQFSHWPEGFAGDLYLMHDGQPVELSGPLEMQADYRQGRLILNYLRALPDRIRLDQVPVILQVYDPGYYRFYDLVGAIEVRGRDGCHVTIRKADIGAAQKLSDQLLGQLTDEEMMEEGRYPEVGGAFADEVVLECNAQP